MKVKELIKELKNLDPNLHVVTLTNKDYGYYDYIGVVDDGHFADRYFMPPDEWKDMNPNGKYPINAVRVY